MHELSVAKSLVELIEGVAAEHRVRRVSSARLEIGELSCVDTDALTFAFEVARSNTVCDTCELQIESVPLVVRCNDCGHQGPTSTELPECSACGQWSVAVVSGRELRLLSIDADDDADGDAENESPDAPDNR